MRLNKYIGGFFILFGILWCGCAARPEVYEHKRLKNVAVWDLENFSPLGDARPDLGELLSARIIETLKVTGDYNVVERERLSIALEELNLGTSSLVDEATCLRLGRISGAQLMIFGGYQVIEEQMRLDLRLVEVETGKILKASGKIVSAIDLSEWLKTAEEVTADLL